MAHFNEERGYLSFAQNNSTTDYLNLAYCQALSIKATQKINSYAIVVDEATSKLLQPKHYKVFDYVQILPIDQATSDEWKLHNEWQAWWLTPFRETIKVESDILFTTNVDHWWDGMQQHEVCLTSHVRDYEGSVGTSRTYRKIFDENLLPDVYNGIMYFRYSGGSQEFFALARDIFNNWDLFKDEILTNCRDDKPSTDVVYAIAAKILGVEKCTNPALSFPTFAHMKSDMQPGWGSNIDWTESLYTEFNGTEMTVGFTRQLYPVHYQKKEFISNEVLTHYEQQ
jgi:hypothetical protein